MVRDHGPRAEGSASFHTTRWTIVLRAAHSQAQGGQSALAELCRLYWVQLDAEDAEERYRLEPVEFLTPEKIFDARLRKRYTVLLREEVSRTVSDPAEVDEEIHAVCEALIASEGQLAP